MVTIAAPLVINQFRWQDITLGLNIGKPSCGANSTQPLSFQWSVYEGMKYLYWLTSSSSDPRTFKLPAYSLNSSSAYTIKVTAAVGGFLCVDA